MSNRLRLPALASAHSHAFQRAMRGTAQRPGPNPNDDFWSWRTSMYALAETLDPSSISRISRVAFADLRRRGVRTVGEFHYVHHDANGAPYSTRTLLSDVVIEAARAEGLRIALLRVIYERAGAGRPPEGAQKRFSDARLDDAFRDIDDLRAKWANDANVVIGVAPHSVRAVSAASLREIAKFAEERSLMVHAHVAEQRAEIAACLAETGKRPVELLADTGVLSPRFVAVHATHLEDHEARLLGEAGAGVCLCPTTERDLGDGLPDLTALVANGVKLSMGVDSHVVTAPVEDLRAIEMGERTRLEKRVVAWRAGESKLTPAQLLWEIGSLGGARACGFNDCGGEVEVQLDHPDLALVAEDHVLDAVVFSASPDVISAS